MAFHTQATCQNTTPPLWENDPRAFLQNLAVAASKEQIVVQEQIKGTEKSIR